MVKLNYCVYKNSKARQEQHPYSAIQSDIHYIGSVELEQTLSNSAEVIQNWINREVKIYNNKRTEAEKKQFEFVIAEVTEVVLATSEEQ
jgi:aspartate 1-decarboxylase